MKRSPLRRGFKKEAEERSIAIRKQLGIDTKAACPARQVAELYGVIVSPAQCLTALVKDYLYDEYPDHQLVANKLDCLLGPGGGFSAVVAIVRGYKMILYNADHSPARQESDIMHEMGHIICQHPGDCLQLNADLGLRHFNESHEEEAKWLGATLQIPERGLFAWAKKGLSNEEIAGIYGASLEMVSFRRRLLAIDKRLNRTPHYIQR